MTVGILTYIYVEVNNYFGILRGYFFMGSSAPKLQRFSPRTTLAAIGIKINSLKLLEPITQTVVILQKSVRHTPAQKLTDALVAILAGAHGLAEINTPVRGTFSAYIRRWTASARSRGFKTYCGAWVCRSDSFQKLPKYESSKVRMNQLPSSPSSD